ncbi:Fructose-1-phosphate phosphatase YqaB [Botrimarina colliarenosi]|uniref:Fructose-1-phosphate phosphatase YqaB n=1 Tax=Botrimarina colliarenosi TaxID=2528001 RepID=A0A5C6A7B2_9BACT|nr:HAD family phosphatase [Botrimarina colliarenosi]TWT95804.1 Fructose-1-phosphate phosphatase YqaB [Botrimarina colliarenosi]
MIAKILNGWPADTAGLVFDCDGTLVDSMPLHITLWDECLVPFGVCLPKGFIDTHAGKPTDIIVEIINAEHGVTIDALEFLDVKEGRFRARLSEVGAIEPVVEVARRYRGVLPMAVVSGGCRENVVESLKAIGALDWFDVILTADDPIAPKPAPDLFLAAAEQLGVPAAKCHAFEDADAGIAAAVAAGMTVTDVRDVLAV